MADLDTDRVLTDLTERVAHVEGSVADCHEQLVRNALDAAEVKNLRAQVDDVRHRLEAVEKRTAELLGRGSTSAPA